LKALNSHRATKYGFEKKKNPDRAFHTNHRLGVNARVDQVNNADFSYHGPVFMGSAGFEA